jgi:hypothetical protein
MAALAKRRYTLAEYLELEKHAEERYAYFTTGHFCRLVG